MRDDLQERLDAARVFSKVYAALAALSDALPPETSEPADKAIKEVGQAIEILLNRLAQDVNSNG